MFVYLLSPDDETQGLTDARQADKGSAFTTEKQSSFLVPKKEYFKPLI